MAEIRFNYGDEFIQNTTGGIGIGTSQTSKKLDVEGIISVGSGRVSGIASLTSYQGFVNTKLTSTENIIVEAGQSGSISGEVVVGTGQTISVSTGATTGQGGIQSLKVYKTFMPPVGGTADRPTDVKPGMVYYNKDFKTIEFWDGNFWKQVDNTTRSGRAIIAAGNSPNDTQSIEFLQITSKGNGTHFGDLVRQNGIQMGGAGSNTRGLIAGGDGTGSELSPALDNNTFNSISYVTIASAGDAIDFGDLSAAGRCAGGASSQTRALFGGVNSTNVIDYVQIQTLGNALDFGDIANQSGIKGYMTSSPTRFFYFSGNSNAPNIEFGIIASKGNTTTFGDSTSIARRKNFASNTTRAIFAGGYTPTSPQTTYTAMDFITMASEGNAVEFGNLFLARSRTNATGDERTCIFAGGHTDPNTMTPSIEFVNYSSQGNAQQFGDLSITRSQGGATSDSHGGLGGF